MARIQDIIATAKVSDRLADELKSKLDGYSHR